MILVTGGAGFIGAHFILDWVSLYPEEKIVNVDKLTYAANLENLKSLENHLPYTFVRADINDQKIIAEILHAHRPRAVIHFAAESHVDRSIEGPEAFISTNITGTFHLLEQCRQYWNDLEALSKNQFRFLHISTDEVYGSLQENDPPFTESTPYAPNSPYSASKAASDHLVRAYYHTYGLPVLTTHCSNNYGPYQCEEKLIPRLIANAISHKKLPIYGDGLNIRDWLYVNDHCEALRIVLEKGREGETYNIGGANEKTNLDVVHFICKSLDEIRPLKSGSYQKLIEFVEDRPGHDRRYAIDASKIRQALGWTPKESFESGLRKTIEKTLESLT